jgi:hypothetical protein
MIIKILAADLIAVSIRIVSPAQDTGLRKVGRKVIAEPVDAVRGRPRFVSMPVQAVDGDNTEKTSVRDTRRDAGLLDDWVCSFRHDLEALRRWVDGRCLRRTFRLLHDLVNQHAQWKRQKTFSLRPDPNRLSRCHRDGAIRLVLDTDHVCKLVRIDRRLV